ncbi:hypothetical protein [Streptomyces mobaraensis]|uniref:Uncharacterized protein n=1 Tax=Streptomyces mobaraensis TaxID=35621 RepID=A0A5N5WDZ6_STRMB|nr:hypothetical protein [Streptomyces mobaraensis]KAB7850150.1 hypothetical protein FRZ00_06005 [Streptomyces mobaraensis]
MWAIFSRDGALLVAFRDDCGRYNPAEMADRTLAAEFADSPGAFVAEACREHEKPLGNCGPCDERINCPSCRWPVAICPAHR